MDSDNNWIESEDTLHSVSSTSGDMWFKCDFAFKVAKDVPRHERLSHLHLLFSAMVEKVDASFGQHWTREIL